MKGGVGSDDPSRRDPRPGEGGLCLLLGRGRAADRQSADLVLDEAPWLRRSSAAVVLEPTDRAIEAGCQGVINAKVVFTGRPAHSARPWLGDNAITKAGAFLTSLRALEPGAACRQRSRVPRGHVSDHGPWWGGPQRHP